MTVQPQHRCDYCDSTLHRTLACPRIKSIRYMLHDGSMVEHVEFHAPTESGDSARPSAIYRPDLYRFDRCGGTDRWGNDIMAGSPAMTTWAAEFGATCGTLGVIGYGTTPAEAIADFDRKWNQL